MQSLATGADCATQNYRFITAEAVCCATGTERMLAVLPALQLRSSDLDYGPAGLQKDFPALGALASRMLDVHHSG